MLFLWKGKIWRALSFSTDIHFHCLLPLRCAGLQLKKTFSVMPFCTTRLRITGQGIGSHILKWCLHLGCEACIITAQDISFPMFTPGSLVPQWEITNPPCDKAVALLQLPRAWNMQLQWRTLWSVTAPFWVFIQEWVLYVFLLDNNQLVWYVFLSDTWACLQPEL